ncbi:MAG TPA: Na+-dependent transporter [Pseudolabrys sp.]
MPILTAIRAALAWLGRQGTLALAVSVFVGVALPQLAIYVKPWLGETVFVLLLFSYLRTDPAAFGRHLRTPGRAIAASIWVMIVLPLVVGGLLAVSGVKNVLPALYTIMILQCAITPITSSAAFAALVGLDVAFSLVGLIICNAMSPITTVAFSYLFLGTSLFSPIGLGITLFIYFAGAAVVAWIIRRVAGAERISREKDLIDGLNVIAVFVFAIAAMGSVQRNFMADPVFAAELLVLAIVLSCTLIGLSMLVFWRAGPDHGLVIGLLAGFRNIGVIMAALGSTLPDLAWFYFAMSQFPIYLLPALLKPLAKRFKPQEA